MKNIFFLLLFIVFCLGCTKSTKTNSFNGDRQFQTNDPARLYFKNIRSVAYYRTRKPHSEVDIYKSKKLAQTDKRPILYPMIVDDWLKNEAYLFLEKNAYSNFATPLTIKAKRDSTESIFTIEVFNKKNQYAFAESIYKALRDKQTLTVKTKKETFVPIFNNYQDKSNFLMTMADYYKLIDKDRKGK